MTASAFPEHVRVPVFEGGGRVRFHERALLAPAPGQLLVRVGANALCGSERGQFQHGSAVTPGHEAAGVVAAAGPGTTIPAGTPGVVYLMGYCGECRDCRLGHTNQCGAKYADYGFTADGGYGPYEVVDERVFFPVDADLSPTEATLLLDVMGTSAHALGRARQVRPDIERVLVTGAGPVGLGLVAMSRLLLGEDVPVFVTDITPYRLDLAEQLGALPISLNAGGVADGLRRHGVRDVDVALDASGKRVAREEALVNLARRGVLVCVGHGEGLDLEVSRDLVATERAVLGSEYFRFDELRENLALLSRHRAYLSQVVTHRFPVEDLQAAFELFFSGRSGKVVIEQ